MRERKRVRVMTGMLLCLHLGFADMCYAMLC